MSLNRLRQDRPLYMAGFVEVHEFDYLLLSYICRDPVVSELPFVQHYSHFSYCYCNKCMALTLNKPGTTLFNLRLLYRWEVL